MGQCEQDFVNEDALSRCVVASSFLLFPQRGVLLGKN